MIPFIDVGFATFIKMVLEENFTVVMSPSDTARESLCRKRNNADTGVPGAAVWRTETKRWTEAHTIPQAHQGFPGPQRTDLDYDAVRIVRTKALYTVSCWVKVLSDRDFFEREIAFSDTYKVVQITIDKFKDEDNVPFNKTISFAHQWSGDFSYKEIPDDASKGLTWYNVETSFVVTGYWMKTKQDPYIAEIVTTYNEVRAGESPIELDTITIVPKVS